MGECSRIHDFAYSTQSRYQRRANAMTNLSDISSADNLQQEQALLEFSNTILQHISKAAPLVEVLNFIARGIEAVEPEMLCSVLLLDESGLCMLQNIVCKF